MEVLASRAHRKYPTQSSWCSSVITPESISNLQELLLRAILVGGTLPGHPEPIDFPDLHLLMRKPEIYLAQENLADEVALDELGKPLLIMSMPDLENLARQRGNTPYLAFLPPVESENEVQLTLVARIAPQAASTEPLGLGGVQITFSDSQGAWAVSKEPVYVAF